MEVTPADGDQAMSERRTPAMDKAIEAAAIEFCAQIPGYGRFRFIAESREQAENMANTKRQWEAAPNCIVWRADLKTKFDQLTEVLADIWLDGSGAPRKLMVRRSKAHAALSAIEVE